MSTNRKMAVLLMVFTRYCLNCPTMTQLGGNMQLSIPLGICQKRRKVAHMNKRWKLKHESRFAVLRKGHQLHKVNLRAGQTHAAGEYRLHVNFNISKKQQRQQQKKTLESLFSCCSWSSDVTNRSCWSRYLKKPIKQKERSVVMLIKCCEFISIQFIFKNVIKSQHDNEAD